MCRRCTKVSSTVQRCPSRGLFYGSLGYEYYNKLGYVPYDVKINENTARTLEYAYNDWCIYRMAKELNRPKKEQKTLCGTCHEL